MKKKRQEKQINYFSREEKVKQESVFEKLGLLYLGREVDLETKEMGSAPFLYKNKNLTTHAAIIGMTGSGKTGLGVGIIEEAMMDNVPSIIIDPKGDMGNLLLTFPRLAPQDFEPWIDSAEAARKEMSVEQYAVKMADQWQRGLESWGQTRERIASLKEKSDLTIYTPGSSAGVSVSVLNSFDPPGEEVLTDTDTLNNMVDGAVTSLLSLVGIKGDSLKNREHILLCSIVLYYWRKGEGLGLEKLISNVVSPPFEKVGVFSLDSFFNQAERMELAMSLNNVLASPTFSSWTRGEPLDIKRILYTESGQPRTAVFCISHLSESERMFFVTMLLNQFVGWMRRQPGSSTLKALLYMDEIFGYFPPTENPPSKKPMMLLLKQARAYGIGVVLATQNPVDLDYKGLSNIGTWFVGRLQTRQDQEKVAEGIAGASDGNLNEKMVKEMLADMEGRRFLLNSIHLDEPLLFQTRWVMSYLKGPMSLNDIKRLMSGRQAPEGDMPQESFTSTAEGELLDHPPLISDRIGQLYHLLPGLFDSARFEPWILAKASVRFYNQKRNIDQVEEARCRFYLGNYRGIEWQEAEWGAYDLAGCMDRPPVDAKYYSLDSDLSSLRDFKGLERDFSDFLYQNRRFELYRVPALKLESRPDEELADFRVRVADLLRDKKDEAVERLKEKYETRKDRLEKQIQRALEKVEKEKVDVKSRTTDTILQFGSAVLGAFFGRRKVSAGSISKVATGMKSAGRIAREKGDVRRAEEQLQRLEEEMEELLTGLQDEIDLLAETFEPDNYPEEVFAIKPRRSDIFDLEVKLLWEMVPE